MGEWKAGDIVRYDYGSTALMQLTSPHAGGWHGKQCMGGATFSSETRMPFKIPSDEDMEMWNNCAKWRK